MIQPSDVRSALQGAAERKTLIMERSVANLRALVVGVNVIAYFLFIGPNQPRAPLALSIVVLASLYAAWSLFTRPYERFPLLRFGAATLVTDTILITLWVLATGGPESEFWVIYIVSVVSVAMRYDLAQTTLAAAGEASIYMVAMAVDGGLDGLAFVIRPAYIMIAGFAAGLLARQERTSREERVVFERLADEHAAMLTRERETVERLRALDRMRSEFVANASHELRTPLTSIVGFSSMIGERHHEMAPEELQTSLDAIKRQGERVKILVQNLLDLSALENERVRLNLSEVPIAKTIERVLEVAPPPLGRPVDVAVPESVRVLADPARLEQVLTNLVVNAYRYGDGCVQVEARAQEGVVTLAVIDQGQGVPPELLPDLFEPFARGQNSTGVTGSGLGLAITRRLIEAQGGEITYEQGTPRGARFVIRLPAAVADRVTA